MLPFFYDGVIAGELKILLRRAYVRVTKDSGEFVYIPQPVYKKVGCKGMAE